MANTALANDIVRKCNELATFWRPRNTKFKEWYSLIEMEDKLRQEGMESFVGNDPQASYKLLLGILDIQVPHRIAPEYMSPDVIPLAGDVRVLFDTIWKNVHSDFRRRGLYWQRHLLAFMLATGWYSVFTIPSADGSKFKAEIWHPATVYPSWDEELIACAHIVPVSPAEAKNLFERAGWQAVDNIPRSTMNLYDYWWLEQGNKVYNATVYGQSNLVKPPTQEGRFRRLPIFTAPVGGLPDIGFLTPDGDNNRWKGEIGQSIVSTNENVYKSWNKWWTFSMQLMRDTAQARIKEKSRSGKPIVKPEDIFKRGAIWRMAPEEDVAFVAPPPIPIEIRSSQLDMEAMMQRGGPSWAMFGNISQQVSAYVMAQISASMNNISKPYHQALEDLYSDIDNFWLRLIRDFGYKPYGKRLPAKLPKDIEISARHDIHIPGDLIQRATTARMLDPEFELSPIRIMQELFPEIENPYEEFAQVQAHKAKRHPVTAAIALIESLRQEADKLERAGDLSGADLYNKAADKAEAMLDITQGEAPETRSPGIRPEVLPPEGARPSV